MTERQQQGGMPLLDIRRNLKSSSAITPLLVSRNFPVNLSIVIVSWSIWWWVCSSVYGQANVVTLHPSTPFTPPSKHDLSSGEREREIYSLKFSRRERDIYSSTPGEREISNPCTPGERPSYITPKI